MINQTFKEKAKIAIVALFFTCIAAIIHGCKSDYNFDEFQVTYTPEFQAPIAQGYLGIEDIINAMFIDHELEADENMLLHAYFSDDSLYYQTAQELLSLPEDFSLESQTLEVGYIPVEFNHLEEVFTLREILYLTFDNDPTVTQDDIDAWDQTETAIPSGGNTGIDRDISLDDVDWSDIDYADIHSGTMIVSITNNYPVDLVIDGELYDVETGETVLGFDEMDVAPGETETKTYDLAGIQLSSDTRARIISLATSGSSTPVMVDLDDTVALDIQFEDLLLDKGKGIFPDITLTQSTQFELDMDDGYHIMLANIEKGKLNVGLETTIPVSGDIVLSSDYIEQDEAPFSHNMRVSNGGTVNEEVSLDNSIVDLTIGTDDQVNQLKFDYTLYLEKSTEKIEISHSDYITISASLDALDFVYLDGKIDETVINLNDTEVDYPLDVIDESASSVRLSNPVLTLIAENSIGLDNAFDVQFVGVNEDGDSSTLVPPAYNIDYPLYPLNDIVYSSLEVNRDNSNIIEFTNLPPTKSLSLQSDLTLNPNAGTDLPMSRIYPDAYLKLGYKFDLSMSMSSDEIHVTRKLAMDELDLDFIDQATLITNVDNHLPLQISLNLSFIDETEDGDVVVASIDPIVIEPAERDENGRSINSYEAKISRDLDKDVIESIKSASALQIDLYFSTPDNGNEEVSLYDDDYLKIIFAVKANLNLNNSDDEE